MLKPTYKSGWTVPGGQMEDSGETPWEACRREVREESGLVIDSGRLVCVDFLRPRPDRPGGMRFLFDCGAFDDETLAGIVVQEDEISEYRLEHLAGCARASRAGRCAGGCVPASEPSTPSTSRTGGAWRPLTRRAVGRSAHQARRRPLSSPGAP